MDTNKKWREKNPLKVAAHTIVNNAVRSGKITKLPCSVCGKEKAHAHHTDYYKPLDIVWLCSSCHRKHHALEKGQKIHQPRSQNCKKRIIHSPQKDRFFEAVIFLRKSGKSYRQIAKEIGVGQGQVYKWLNKTPYK